MVVGEIVVAEIGGCFVAFAMLDALVHAATAIPDTRSITLQGSRSEDLMVPHAKPAATAREGYVYRAGLLPARSASATRY